MTEWVDTIEEPIRPLVKLLRDNGFNTECSCGHEMYVQCQYIPDGELYRLFCLLYNTGYHNFMLEVRVDVVNGCPQWSAELKMTENAREVLE